MRNKIQLKLNSDVLITVIQMIEKTDNYSIETTLDAIIISIKEDLVEKLIEKSKTIQKQVSILDHNKKHLVVLKYHEVYTLHTLLEQVAQTGSFDTNIHIKKVKRLISELQNKVDINTKEEQIDECNNSHITESSTFNTYAYPQEDHISERLTDLVYTIALDAIDKLPEEIQDLDFSISSTEIVKPNIENTQDIQAKEVITTEESIIETTEPTVEKTVEEVITAEESIIETTEPIAEETIEEVITAEESIIETTEPIAEKTIEEAITTDEIIIEEATTEEILAKATKTANKKKRKNTEEQSITEVKETKEKAKKTPKASSDLGQMSLF
ncbi:MAG: hypothetical protein LBE34_04840 [Flavobacteriaceae bacterium]|jgi:hypothetical protein|nr:hypothetical protein [Flavobacteriaceae bacterium]